MSERPSHVILLIFSFFGFPYHSLISENLRCHLPCTHPRCAPFTTLKDPIGYQQTEQRMIHDVHILSYLELKVIPPIFVRPRKRRSLFHRFISRCRRLKPKKISLVNSKTFCRRSQARLPRAVSSVSAPIHPMVRVHQAQCGRMRLRRRLLAYQKVPRPLRADENESSRKSLQNRVSGTSIMR